MKRNYTLSSAKSMITRNKGRFEGKAIIVDYPGIKVLGAIDFLKTAGYYWKREPVKPRKKSFVEKLIDLRNEIIEAITIKEK